MFKFFTKFCNKNFSISIGTSKTRKTKVIGWPPLIICGPSGTGKTTLKDYLIKFYPDSFDFSVSYTTREPRNNERHGVDYFFVEKDTFDKEIDKNNFLEYAKVHDNHYGTHRDVVGSIVNSGKICILDIDVQGVKMALANGLVVANRIFVEPPSLDALKQRLEERGLDSKEVIEKRVKRAAKEIELAHQLNLFHVFIRNEDKDLFIKDCLGLIKGWYPFIEKEKNK